MSDNSLPTVEMAVLNAEAVAALRQALYGIRRDALSVVNACENLLGLPYEKSAIRTGIDIDKERAIKTQAEIIAERNLAYRERMKTEKTARHDGYQSASHEAKSVSSVDSLDVSC